MNSDKTLVISFKDEVTTQIGIARHHCKNPYWPTSRIECNKPVASIAQIYLWKVRYVSSPPASLWKSTPSLKAAVNIAISKLYVNKFYSFKMFVSKFCTLKNLVRPRVSPHSGGAGYGSWVAVAATLVSVRVLSKSQGSDEK